MMNNTQEVKAYYEYSLQQQLEETLELVKTQGITDDTYTRLRVLNDFLTNANAAQSFFRAWNTESEANQPKKAV